MSSKQGRNRNSGAVADKREGDSKGSPERSESSLPDIPLSFQYETEDGLFLELTPQSASISREYELSEGEYLEFDAGVDWDIIDIGIERDRGNTDISGSLEVPGDILGIGGGIEIDLATGEITGGEISAEAAGIALDLEVSDRGCIVSVGLSLFGFGVSYTKDVCEDEDEQEPEEEKDPEREGGDFDELDALENYEDSLPPGCQITVFYAYHGTRWSGEPWKEGGGLPPASYERGNVVTTTDDYGNSSTFDEGAGAWLADSRGSSYPGTETGYGGWLIEGQLWYEGFATTSGSPKAIKARVKSSQDLGNICEPTNSTFLDTDDCYHAHPWTFMGLRVWGCVDYPREPYRYNQKKDPPGKPPMRRNECCSASTKMIREVHLALGTRELLDNQLIVPNRLVVPNGRGSAKLKTYLDIASWQMRMADHLGIHPFKASLTDANAAQAGNQKVEIQFASGTAGLKQVIELLLENKGDAAARLNLQVRTAVAIAQVLKVATITSKTASAIASFIGMPLREKISKIRMPFDISLGRRRNLKGFDPAAQKEAAIEAIGMNEEASTEEILPEFLQTGEQPYIHESYDGNFPNLIEQLKGGGGNG